MALPLLRELALVILEETEEEPGEREELCEEIELADTLDALCAKESAGIARNATAVRTATRFFIRLV